MAKFTVPIDLSYLREIDARYLRALLVTDDIPDGVRRFAVSALYRTDPQLSTMAQSIRDINDFKVFTYQLCLLAMAESEATRQRVPQSNLYLWFIQLLRDHYDLLPDNLGQLVAQVVRRHAGIACGTTQAWN